MNSLNQKKTSNTAHAAKGNNQNSFARALLETEKKASSNNPNEEKKETNPFAQALSQAGGDLGEKTTARDQEKILAKQQDEFLKQQEKEVLRKKLHDKVNPVETYDVFKAEAKRNKEELRKVRDELKMLIKDIKDLDKEIDLAVSKDVADPGTDASYYFNFFHKLRQWIMIMRQKVKDASTWASQVRGKQSRGSAFSFKKSKNVHQSMNSERNFGMNMGG